ncbi:MULTISPECIES: alpha/beta fold hydrolase [Nocardioides]|uniref:Alpha/beta fold hydrolase n=1 Tax=Nocardioides vastitatis TaxID=2568655 RepID=A0ABW0ZDX2_9ACTN|nr:alpha/beta fold hydrolase [Nocardioides sp.]THI96552.1 alpha/beta fold hydrolase [Nocardioides sp.]
MEYNTRHNLGSSVVADDGRELPLVTYEPAQAPVGVVLVVPAMATAASFYEPFCRWLAEQGFRAVTFDYRGMGGPAQMRAETADVDRWFADAALILDAVADAADGLPITWVGHSLGGQMVPFVDHGRLAQVITVAAGDGYWRRNAPRIKWVTPLLFAVVAPLAIRVAGYYPGSRLRMLADVPAGAMRQWGRWCRHPEYLQADHPEAPGLFASVKAPLMSLSFEDDELLSAESIKHLHDWYVNADQVRQRYSPAQLDGRRVGHHGFFRKANVDLWEELVLPWVASAV